MLLLQSVVWKIRYLRGKVLIFLSSLGVAIRYAVRAFLSRRPAAVGTEPQRLKRKASNARTPLVWCLLPAGQVRTRIDSYTVMEGDAGSGSVNAGEQKARLMNAPCLAFFLTPRNSALLPFVLRPSFRSSVRLFFHEQRRLQARNRCMMRVHLEILVWESFGSCRGCRPMNYSSVCLQFRPDITSSVRYWCYGEHLQGLSCICG